MFRRLRIGIAFGHQKLICRDAQNRGEGFNPIDRHAVFGSLEQAHIRTI